MHKVFILAATLLLLTSCTHDQERLSKPFILKYRKEVDAKFEYYDKKIMPVFKEVGIVTEKNGLATGNSSWIPKDDIQFNKALLALNKLSQTPCPSHEFLAFVTNPNFKNDKENVEALLKYYQKRGMPYLYSFNVSTLFSGLLNYPLDKNPQHTQREILNYLKKNWKNFHINTITRILDTYF